MVARRAGLRNATRQGTRPKQANTESVRGDFFAAKPGDTPAGQQVVGDVQHVIGVVVGQMDLTAVPRLSLIARSSPSLRTKSLFSWAFSRLSGRFQNTVVRVVDDYHDELTVLFFSDNSSIPREPIGCPLSSAAVF